MSNFKFLEDIQENKNNDYISINNKSDIEIEEESIQKLIEEIYKEEQKLNLLKNNSLQNKNNNEPNLKKLSQLNEIKENIEKNISQYNNSISIEIKKNDISSEHKKILLNELEQKINENKTKLNLFNTLNFKFFPLIKYIFSNKTKEGFLSKEQIDDILNNKNNLSDEDELKKIIKEKDVNKASQTVIENNIYEYKLKKEQIEENLKMLEEEKNSSNDELIDIISCKESVDSIMKLIIEKLIKNKNNLNQNEDNININNDNEIEEDLNKPTDILINELLCLDSSKTAIRICEDLYDIYDLDNNNNIIYTSKYHNKSCIFDGHRTKNRSGSYESDILNSKNMNSNNYKLHKRSGSNNLSTKMNEMIKDNINYNDERILIDININSIKKQENNLDKKILTKLIQNEIETFLNTQSISNNNSINENLLNDFLYNLSMLIINKMKNIVESLNKKENNYNNIFISSNDLIVYLSYFFKSFYYETLIENKLKFINKDYKLLKKEIKKNLSDITNELIKLEDKLDEIKIKEKINLNLLEIIQKNSTGERDSQDIDSNLTQSEINYIQLSIKLNDFISEREKIKNEIEKNNNDLIKKKEENEIKINKLNNELNNIKNEIKKFNNDVDIFNVHNNDEINNCRKIISKKINEVKIKLKLYKNKRHGNLNQYNQFYEKINNLLNHNMNINKSIFNYDKLVIKEEQKQNIDNNYFINGNELIINDIEKNHLEKKLLKKNRKYFYNPLLGIGMNGSTITNNTSKKLNRSMTGMNNGNNSVNNIYNIYNNFDNNINLNNNSIINNRDKKILNKTSTNIYSKNNFSILNNSKNLEDTQINFNLPFNKKRHNIYNMSSLPNTNDDKFNNLNLNITKCLNSNKNKSTTNIRAKIKEIKKISNKIANIKNNNIPNMNKISFQTKRSPFHTGNNNSSRVAIDEQLKLNNIFKEKNEKKEKKAYSHGKQNAPSLPLNTQKDYFKKLNPLTKNTLCYYRELINDNNQNNNKYNPLNNIKFDILCKSPYNFIKSNINLSKNYDFISIIESNNYNLKIKTEEIENTVVSSSIKKIIEIFRNYNKLKDKNNFSLDEFINRESNLYPDMKKEDIKKSAMNHNYNFSLITSKGKRLEFIICSYEEFKMWINGLAFIIKNRNELSK